MAAVTLPQPSFNDTTLLKLAREIATDIHQLDDVLRIHNVSASEWELIQQLPVFQTYLTQSIEAWNSAANTADRVKLKSLSFVEEALPEFFARAHDKEESLAAKTEVLKTIAKFAGLGNSVVEGSVGEKLTVTINLGADQQLRMERDITPQVTIEGSAE